jgi:hypothetical protein
MAVGDIVNGISNADLTFQPAAGVSIAITHAVGWLKEVLFTNGVIDAYILFQGDTKNGGGENTKIMINNTNYLKVLVNANGTSYSGIQIQ